MTRLSISHSFRHARFWWMAGGEASTSFDARMNVFFARMILNLNARTAGEEREEKTPKNRRWVKLILVLGSTRSRKKSKLELRKMFRAGTERRGSFVTLISSASLSFKIFFFGRWRGQNWHTQKCFVVDLSDGNTAPNDLIYAKAFARFLTASFIDCYTSDIPSSSSSGGNILRVSSGLRSIQAMFFARKQIIFNRINGEINFYFAIARKFFREWSLTTIARRWRA